MGSSIQAQASEEQAWEWQHSWTEREMKKSLQHSTNQTRPDGLR